MMLMNLKTLNVEIGLKILVELNFFSNFYMI